MSLPARSRAARRSFALLLCVAGCGERFVPAPDIDGAPFAVVDDERVYVRGRGLGAVRPLGATELHVFPRDAAPFLPPDGAYEPGLTRPCPLPRATARYALDDTLEWRQEVTSARLWVEDPRSIERVLPIASTCGLLLETAVVEASDCAVRLPASRDGPMPRAGLTADDARPRLEPFDRAFECEGEAGVDGALGALTCERATGPCAVDVFPEPMAPRVEVFSSQTIGPRLEGPGGRSAFGPRVRGMTGLAYAGGRVWVVVHPEVRMGACAGGDALVALDPDSLQIVERHEEPSRCLEAVFVAPDGGAGTLTTLSRVADGEPAPECPTAGGEPRSRTPWRADLRDARGVVTATFGLGERCADRAIVAPSAPSDRVAIVGLATTDTAGDLHSGRLAVIALEVAPRRGFRFPIEGLGNVTTIVPWGSGGREWLVLERRSAQATRLERVGLEQLLFLPLPLNHGGGVLGASRIDERVFLSLLEPSSSLWVSTPTPSDLGIETVTAFDGEPSQAGPAIASSALAGVLGARARTPWPIVAIDSRTPRRTNLRWLEHIPTSGSSERLRLRPERVELGTGAVGEQVAVDAEGRAFVALVWEGRVVRVSAR